MYEGAQRQFAGILEQVGKDVKEYLDMQSMADCMAFMDESFESLCKFSDTFNVFPFIPVVMGMAITHHSLLTSLPANVSHTPLKIFLSPLTSNAMATSGQMALLSYMAQQGVAIQEKQAQSKLMPEAGTGEVDPTLESNYESSVSMVQWKPILGKVGLTPSKKDWLEAQSSKTPLLPTLPQDPPEPPQADTPPPPSLAMKHSTPKAQNMHPSGLMTSLLAQFQQSHLCNASPKNTPSKTTPIKNTPKKGEPMPSKKLLTPDKTVERPIKKQQTGSPSS